MRLSRTIAIIVLLVVVALAVVTVLTNSFGGTRGTQVVVFPDGTRVQVLGAVRGGTPFSTEKFWTRPLRKVLPTTWRQWLPLHAVITCGGGRTNEIVVFLSFTAPAGGGPLPWEWLAAVDDDGFRFPLSGGSCSTSAGGKNIHGITLPAFPRRQKFFRLDFIDPNHKVIARAQLANPLPVPPPQQSWSAEIIPITRTNGELTLTLASAREGTNQWGSYLIPKWQTQALDPRWKNTQIGYFRVSDPVGNEGGFLSRQERVWQVQTTFHRKRREDFSADEKLVATNLTVPAPGETIPLNLSRDCAGVQITLDGIYGAGTLYITNGVRRAMTSQRGAGWGTTSNGKTTVEYIGATDPFLLVDAVGMSSSDELRLHLTDDQGREIKLEERSSYQYRMGTQARTYLRSFAPTNEVKSLSLEIIVSHPKEFVFYINPDAIEPPHLKKP